MAKKTFYGVGDCGLDEVIPQEQELNSPGDTSEEPTSIAPEVNGLEEARAPSDDPVLDSSYAEDFGNSYERWLEAKKRNAKKLRGKANALYTAMELWPTYADSEEEWVALCEKTFEEYHSGRFFLEQLGAERYLEPKLFATLWMLRNALVEDMGTNSAAEEMLIDMMMMGYANTLRVQGWVGNLALDIEREFFDEYGLHELYDVKNGGRHTDKGMWVEGMLKRMREQLLPVLDRCNRMTIRNLRAIQELRRGPAPTVAIGKAEQVNVASQQVNQAG